LVEQALPEEARATRALDDAAGRAVSGLATREQQVRDQRQSGLTTVELLAALGVMLVLVTIAIPLKKWDEKRRRENDSASISA
jgi:hypothetical protein